VGAGRSLRMELRGENRQRAVAEAFERSVVQVPVSGLDLRRKRPFVHGEAMILRRDRDRRRPQVRHRVVCAAVAELQLEGLPAKRETKKLMPEADPEDRLLVEETLDRADLRSERGRIAGAVGEEDAVRLRFEDRAGRGGRRKDGYAAARSVQQPHDVALHPVIHGRHVKSFVRRRKDRAPRGRYGQSEVGPDHRWRLPHEPQDLPLVGDLGGETRAHRALRPDAPHERPRVQAVEARDALLLEVAREALLAPRAAPALREIARDEAGDVHLLRLRLVPPHAVVADMGRRHDDDLSRVGGIGQHFLVPAHRRVEDDLAERSPRRADRLAVEARAILEDEDSSAHRELL
jgi:hypothetical protein